jgi:hypothetical protein
MPLKKYLGNFRNKKHIENLSREDKNERESQKGGPGRFRMIRYLCNIKVVEK